MDGRKGERTRALRRLVNLFYRDQKTGKVPFQIHYGEGLNERAYPAKGDQVEWYFQFASDK